MSNQKGNVTTQEKMAKIKNQANNVFFHTGKFFGLFSCLQKSTRLQRQGLFDNHLNFRFYNLNYLDGFKTLKGGLKNE
jgi:hypothetical protein